MTPASVSATAFATRSSAYESSTWPPTRRTPRALRRAYSFRSRRRRCVHSRLNASIHSSLGENGALSVSEAFVLIPASVVFEVADVGLDAIALDLCVSPPHPLLDLE